MVISRYHHRVASVTRAAWPPTGTVYSGSFGSPRCDVNQASTRV